MPLEVYLKLLEIAEKFLGPIIAKMLLDRLEEELTIEFDDDQKAQLAENRRKLLDLRADAVERS